MGHRVAKGFCLRSTCAGGCDRRQPPGETEAGGSAAWRNDAAERLAVTGPGSEPRVHGRSTWALPTVGSRRPFYVREHLTLDGN